MLVTILRHGETVWQAAGRYQGISDVPLSQEGLDKLGPADFAPRRVYVTPLCRTAQTAAALFPGVEQVVVPGLEEMNFGAFEGKNYRELSEDPDYCAWVDSRCELPCPGGESRAEFCARVRPAFERLMEENRGEPELVLVAHGGIQMALMEAYCGQKRSYFDWHIGCGKGYRLDASRWETDRTLELMNVVDYTRS